MIHFSNWIGTYICTYMWIYLCFACLTSFSASSDNVAMCRNSASGQDQSNYFALDYCNHTWLQTSLYRPKCMYAVINLIVTTITKTIKTKKWTTCKRSAKQWNGFYPQIIYIHVFVCMGILGYTYYSGFMGWNEPTYLCTGKKPLRGKLFSFILKGIGRHSKFSINIHMYNKICFH